MRHITCYRVLSKLLSRKAPYGYRGIARQEPVFREEDGEDIHRLWYKYYEYYETGAITGVSNELKLDELFYFCKEISIKHNVNYEVISIGGEKNLAVDAKYYGIDVASIGGYSMIGEGFFHDCVQDDNAPCSKKIRSINQFFKNKLNQYGLFNNEEDASAFLKVLAELRSCGLVEQEESYIFHISRIYP